MPFSEVILGYFVEIYKKKCSVGVKGGHAMMRVARSEGRTRCRELAGNEVGVSLRGAK